MKKKYKGIAFILILILMLLAGGCGKADVNVENDGSMESPAPDTLQEKDGPAKKEDALEEEENKAGEDREEDKKQEKKEGESQEPEKEDFGTEKAEKTESSADSDTPLKKTPATETPYKETDSKSMDGDSNTGSQNDKGKKKDSKKNKNNKDKKNKDKNKEGAKNKTKDKISSPEKKEDPQAVLDKALAAVKEALQDKYNANTAIDSEWLLNVCGVEEDWYDAAVGEQPMISANVDTYISIHATKGNVKKVAAALKEYRRYLIEDSMQYPMNQPKVEACKVITKGDYVFFVMLGVLDDMELEESEQKSAYEAMNQTAIEAIERVIS